MEEQATANTSPMSARSRVNVVLASVRELGGGRLRLLGVVTGGHVVIHWFQQLFPLALPFIKGGLGLSDVQVGALTMARQFGQGTLNLPAGVLADSLHRHRDVILALALLLMGAAYMLFGIAGGHAFPVNGFWLAFLASGLVGLGTALWHPTAAAVLSSRFPGRRATALSIHGMGATLSDSLAPLALGALFVFFAWEWVLVWQILPGVLLGFLLWRALLGTFRDDDTTTSPSSRFREMTALLKSASFVGISASRGLLTMGRIVILTFLPVYLTENLHYSAFVLGIYIMLLHIVGIVSQPLLGYLSDRFGRKIVLLPSMIALSVLYILLAVVSPGIPLTLVITAMGTFFYTLMNVITAAVMDVAGDTIQASSQGLTTVITQVAVLPTPVLAGFLAESYGIESAFLLAGAFAFLAATVLLPLRLYGGDLRSLPHTAPRG